MNQPWIYMCSHPEPPSCLPPHPILLGHPSAPALSTCLMHQTWTGWRGCGEKGTLLHCWWECKLVQPLWRTVWRFLKKLKIELPYDPAISLQGIQPVNLREIRISLGNPEEILRIPEESYAPLSVGFCR